MQEDFETTRSYKKKKVLKGVIEKIYGENSLVNLKDLQVEDPNQGKEKEGLEQTEEEEKDTGIFLSRNEFAILLGGYSIFTG